MTVTSESNKLKLGKGVAFVKSQLLRLRQEDDAWEADFLPIPGSGGKHTGEWVGMVISRDHYIFAERTVEEPPTVNDLASLLADAMRRPLALGAHRPRTLYLRARPAWNELMPHLKQIGVQVVVEEHLPKWDEAFEEFFGQAKKSKSVRKPTARSTRPPLDESLPAVARWVREWGWIEIGQQELFGFVARALHEGGTQVEINKFMTLQDAMVALEKGLADWFKEQRIEVD